MGSEFCIMPESPLYFTERKEGLHRHEVFFGSNRQKSIDMGLVVFLPPELHNMSKAGVHFNREFDLKLKRIGQTAAMSHYNLTTEEFIKIFGRNYI